MLPAVTLHPGTGVGRSRPRWPDVAAVSARPFGAPPSVISLRPTVDIVSRHSQRRGPPPTRDFRHIRHRTPARAGGALPQVQDIITVGELFEKAGGGQIIFK